MPYWVRRNGPSSPVSHIQQVQLVDVLEGKYLYWACLLQFISSHTLPDINCQPQKHPMSFVAGQNLFQGNLRKKTERLKLYMKLIISST